MNTISEFMQQLGNDLVSKKGITESSAISYIKNLYALNAKQPFNNLSFLRNTQAVDEILNGYKDNTKKTYLSAIVSILSLYKDKPTYKKIYQHYYDLMMNKAHEMNESNINVKSTAQNENWISWEQVIHIKEAIKEAIIPIIENKFITPVQFEVLLAYLILSLYTDIPPRRNQDYMDMYFVTQYDDNMDQNRNYLDWTNKKLIFLKYKTAKKYGKQVIDISDNKNLIEALTYYLKFHPLNPTHSLKKLLKNTNFKLLVYSDGSPLVAVNAITRILNKIFNKKVGSSMLRHIYLSSKYNIKDMKEDAKMMGHSLNEQRQYIKEDDINTEDEFVDEYGNNISDTEKEPEVNVNKIKEPKTPKPKKDKKNNKNNII